jgi:hypothetical protein
LRHAPEKTAAFTRDLEALHQDLSVEAWYGDETCIEDDPRSCRRWAEKWAETKGSLSSLDLRPIEDRKIDCARRFFAMLSTEQVRYDVVDSYEKLMSLVK